MYNVHLMAVVNGLQQLENVSLDRLLRQTCCPLFKNLEKRLVDELKDEIKFSFSILKWS